MVRPPPLPPHQTVRLGTGVGGRSVRALCPGYFIVGIDMQNRSNHRGMNHRDVRRGFSLIELLVTIAIIALIVSIIIPALGSVRKSAKLAETRNLMNSLQQAMSSYQLSERRTPGYFTAQEMGAQTNETQGFSGMQNAMLDLAGGVCLPAQKDGDVGPSATALVPVNRASVGTKKYFTPDPKFYKVQAGLRVGSADNTAWPDLIDSFGAPILLWTADEAANTKINSVASFALNDSGTGAAVTRARFYRAQNATYLDASAVGTSRINMSGESILGGSFPGRSDDTTSRTLTTLLGSPNSPNFPPTGQPAATYQTLLPSGPRGTFVIHSAGLDATYLAREDKKGRGYVVNNAINYGQNHLKQDNTALTGPDGKPTSIDVAQEFDDIIMSGGN